MNEALGRYGKPDIFATDQGLQFTSVDFMAVLNKADIAFTMDGRGIWRDKVYLHAYQTVSEAHAGTGC